MIEGNIRKMPVELNGTEVIYRLQLGESEILLNEIVGKQVDVNFSGQINCVHCGKKIKKTYGQGFCYPCFISVPEADPAIVKPELDMAHEGIARDMEWAKTHSLIDHFVYFAFTGDVKVGVTRHNQIPTRWIDQGASKAIILAKTPYRNLAGQIEVELKKYFADKTNWRKMLSDISCENDILLTAKNKAIDLLPDNLKEYIFEDNTVTELNYPVIKYPQKVKSLKLDKNPQINKTLTGIKGQYLIFDDNTVINIRNHSGYYISFDYSS